MTQFGKARWSTDGETLRLGMDFSKVDKKRRMVSGWATLDNVDTENDVVTAEASRDAFARSRMNLREMHKKDSAVGRIVSFKEDTFRAPDGNAYNGIFVKVYVSEGAEDTWMKVVDGTLNGFSIGGNIVDAQEEFAKDGATKIRKVTKYNLNELSLVDNPGNQYSDITNVFKIQKSADGAVTSVTGMIEDFKVLNVFHCTNDSLTKEAASDEYECPVCDKTMERIGFVEDSADRDGKVNALVAKVIGGGGENTLSKNNDELNSGTGTGGTGPVLPGTDESEATGHVDGDPQEVPSQAAPADVDEVEDEGEAIAKKVDSLKNDILTILSKSQSDNNEQIAALRQTIDEVTENLTKQTSDIKEELTKVKTGLDEIGKDLSVTKSNMTALENSLEKMNSGGALKKSADGSTPAAQEQNNDPWDGSAFSVNGLLRS